MLLNEAEHLLDTYEFTELLELNDLTEADVLVFLVDHRFIKLPNIKPLDV